MRILQIQHWEPRFVYDSVGYFERHGDMVDDFGFFPGPGGRSTIFDEPDPEGYDAVIVYGGYMSAYDDAGHPWLADELRYIERCARAGTPLLGICLGSQLFARMLGARVFRTPVPEFGFARILPTPEGAAHPAFGRLFAPAGGPVAASADAEAAASSPFTGLEWHEDAWDLPSGATRIATGDHWENQAFAYGDRMLAIQFHLEFTHEHMRAAFAEERENLPRGPACADPEAVLADRASFDATARSMELLLDGVLGR